MQVLLLGLAALVIGLVVLEGFTRANPAALARQLKLAGGAVALAIGAVLLLRGMAGPATIAGAVGSWLLGWGGGFPWGSRRGFGGGTPAPGQTTSLTTDHLSVLLDHATGTITGRVLKGIFAGRDFESLKPVELALLWQDCRFVDPQSAEVLEAYLDRAHPSWREDVARGEREMRDKDGRMQPADALQILGLEPGATEEQIRRAHRDLMLKVHPDRGGSTYLAAQVNEAKDVLLGS